MSNSLRIAILCVALSGNSCSLVVSKALGPGKDLLCPQSVRPHLVASRSTKTGSRLESTLSVRKQGSHGVECRRRRDGR
ncbi:hypothetical protein B0T17DRAFT_546279 [Bombardia bombarda]|uniref:Secreted protein n=1 Tax=Bombardia bombarda TaxID=252184 RepID=A0AA39U0E8_9PEZI|nr:hypothetical protein B0T17DRAFT_546279 [Bombardia bombarda]